MWMSSCSGSQAQQKFRTRCGSFAASPRQGSRAAGVRETLRGLRGRSASEPARQPPIQHSLSNPPVHTPAKRPLLPARPRTLFSAPVAPR